LIKVEEGVAYLRLQGSCHGCPSSTITLKSAIEEAINKAAPDLDGLKVEGVTEPPVRPGIPVTFVPARRKDNSRSTEQENGWKVVTGLASLRDGALKVVTVQQEPLLFCQMADTYYAYRNRCSQCNASLDNGKLEGSILVCSSCGRRYDLYRAGRCLDAPDLFLQPVPLLVEGGQVKVAMSALAKDDTSEAAFSAPVR
jgi:nitrite reductase/ring-hydroxylating ferredoxin subunit